MPHPDAQYYGNLSFPLSKYSIFIKSLVFNAPMTAAKISYIGNNPNDFSLESFQILTVVGTGGTLVSLPHNPYPEFSATEVQITLKTGEYGTQEVVLESGERVLYVALDWIESKGKSSSTSPMIGLMKAKKRSNENSFNDEDHLEVDRRIRKK